jgi:DNA-binding MarR family transcriptional regulator
MSQDFNHDLLFTLHDVARLVRVEADKRARRHGMTRAQWALLMRLARNPGLSQKEIADLLEVEPISVARLVDRMEAVGLVERRADEDDRRIWRLHLRPAATGMLDMITNELRVLAETTTGGIAQPVRDAMRVALLQMKSNLAPATPAAQPTKIMETA